MDLKSFGIGVVIGVAGLRGVQYIKEMHDFKKVKEFMNLDTKARTARAYAKEVAEKVRKNM